MKRISFALIYLFFSLPVFSEEAFNKSSEKSKISTTEELTPVSKTGVFIPGEIVPMSSIVIRGRREPVIEQAGTGTVITEEQISAHGDKSLDEVLSSVPGLYIDIHTKGYTRLRIRGYEQDRVLILMDGIPINDVYSTDFDIATIPAVNISKVIISRGVTSSLYGAASAVGVINIISKSPRQLYAQGKTEYGPYGNWSLNAACGGPINNFYFWFTGSVINSDGFKPSEKLDKSERRKWFDTLIPYQLYGETFDSISFPAKDGYINDTGLWDHSNYRKYDTTTKLGYNLKSGEAGLLARYNYKTGRTNTYEASCYSSYKTQNDPPWEHPVFDADQTSIKKAALRERAFVWPGIYNFQVAPYFRYDFGILEFKTLAYFSYRKAVEQGYASVDHEYIKDQPAVLSGTAYDPYNDIKTYSTIGENTVFTFKPVTGHRISAALLWKKDSFLEEEQAISAEKSPNIAATSYGTDPYKIQFLEVSYFSLGLEYEARLHGRLYVTIGVSYDSQNFSKFKQRHNQFIYEDAYIVKDDSAIMGTRDAINPVGGVVYDVFDDLLKLKLAGSAKTRFPTLGEYSKIDEEHDYNLKSEKIYNISTGFELSFFENSLIFSSDYYYTTIKDRIKKIAGGTEPPVNIDKAVSQGVENSIKYTLLPKTGWLRNAELIFTYTYLRMRYYDDTVVTKGKYADYTPAHQFTADISCEFITGTRVSLWGEHIAGTLAYVMKSVPENDAPYSTSYYGTADLHDPYFLNIKISQQFKNHYTAYFLCKNILDDYKADPFNPGPGRMFYAGITAEL